MNKKLFLISFSIVILSIFTVYIGYLVFNKTTGGPAADIDFVLVPSRPDECKTCQIVVLRNGFVSITSQTHNAPTTATGLKISNLTPSPDGAGHSNFDLIAPGGKPSLKFFGSRLKTQLDASGMIDAGYAPPADGFGYVLVTQQSDLNGMSGEIPITWVKMKLEN
ncbi:hypothetical protein R6242_19525 [Iodobacter sp. CM08]|uniref:hypothetical protein n=1 Tax=Iodobacter sp. CM08 TaxID=3085902 RepID=UPI0029819418|nr:hypothetical protein [Iodobacter sp. CM08]MDW5418763.1 hypothetical protein [Iodobacter sp. CM08]